MKYEVWIDCMDERSVIVEAPKDDFHEMLLQYAHLVGVERCTATPLEIASAFWVFSYDNPEGCKEIGCDSTEEYAEYLGYYYLPELDRYIFIGDAGYMPKPPNSKVGVHYGTITPTERYTPFTKG